MDRTMLRLQVAVLAVGTAFSWITLALDYRRFFDSGGEVFAFSGCVVTNPAATPCFYGAIAFAAAFAWSLLVLRGPGPEVGRRQRGLHVLLVAGTLFAWGNLAYETWRYLQPHPAPSAFSCSPSAAIPNPLLTACFYGALIFAGALTVSQLIRRHAR